LMKKGGGRCRPLRGTVRLSEEEKKKRARGSACCRPSGTDGTHIKIAEEVEGSLKAQHEVPEGRELINFTNEDLNWN